MLLVGAWLSLSALADTVLLPRTKTAHDEDLKALHEKYGAEADAAAIEAAKSEAAELQPPQQAPGAAPEAKQSRVQLSLTPGPGDRLRLAETALDSEALIAEVERLRGGARIDSLLLLEDAERPISAGHLVALQRIAEHFDVLALYQKGSEILPLGAQPRAAQRAN